MRSRHARSKLLCVAPWRPNLRCRATVRIPTLRVYTFVHELKLIHKCMAGAVGFEPTHPETKTQCLTAWLRPIVVGLNYQLAQISYNICSSLPLILLSNLYSFALLTGLEIWVEDNSRYSLAKNSS